MTGLPTLTTDGRRIEYVNEPSEDVLVETLFKILKPRIDAEIREKAEKEVKK